MSALSAQHRLAISRARMQHWLARRDSTAAPAASPLAPLAALTGELAPGALHEIAQRHPLALAGTAVAAGALLASARPWPTLAEWLGRLLDELPPSLLADLFMQSARHESGSGDTFSSAASSTPSPQSTRRNP